MPCAAHLCGGPWCELAKSVGICTMSTGRRGWWALGWHVADEDGCVATSQAQKIQLSFAVADREDGTVPLPYHLNCECSCSEGLPKPGRGLFGSSGLTL